MMNGDVYVRQCLQTHPLCQQNMRGCRTSFDLHSRSVFLFFCVLALGCALLTRFLGKSVVEYRVRYDDACAGNGDTAAVAFRNAEMKRAFVYYELRGFYQSHSRIMGSFSGKQMNGRFDKNPKCAPGNSSFLPCGLLPTMFFNDTYALENGTFTEKGINFRDEIGKLFSGFHRRYYEESGKYYRWMLEDSFAQSFPGEIQNEHFVQWMKVSMHPNFRKLYAKSVNVVPENLVVNVTCNYPKSIFDGERYLVLMETGRMGGRNMFVSNISFFIFAMNFVFCIVLFMPCMTRKPYYQVDDVPLLDEE